MYSGVIKVSRPLDREEMHRHMLTVMVQDQGAATKKSFTRVEIDIEDVNDHKPSFLLAEIEGRVHETASIGHSILQVFALDHDKGNNAELTYSILSGLMLMYSAFILLLYIILLYVMLCAFGVIHGFARHVLCVLL